MVYKILIFFLGRNPPSADEYYCQISMTPGSPDYYNCFYYRPDDTYGSGTCKEMRYFGESGFPYPRNKYSNGFSWK